MEQHLFTPLTLRGVTLRNRIGVSPMCQYSAKGGFPDDWHLVHLGARAVGGAALVMAEATAVEPRGRITPGCTGIWSDAHTDRWARIARFIAAQGAVPGIQLAHAGRKASRTSPWEGDRSLEDHEGGWPVVGPSPVAFSAGGWRVPSALTAEEIAGIVRAFAAAAGRARQAGFQWVELHAAHGYLCHSFYSPLSNRRDDAYGGTFEGRIRFTLEAARAVRDAWPEALPMSTRLSCTDWADGGFVVEDAVALGKRLGAEGVDLIDCSSGGNSLARIPLGPGYQVPLAEAVRRGAGIPTAAVGMITTPAQANQIVTEGKADLVLFAREMLRDPSFPVRAAEALGQRAALHVPPQYLRAIPPPKA
jgi:2,4-dienoyl-CoA reductase-like NADH-dependent reductase (Old Yellow Enzyme family)